MLVAGLLVALRLGACRDTGGFGTYVHLDQGGAYTILGDPFPSDFFTSNGELCARDATMDEVYAGPHPCLVSHAYKCCTTFPPGVNLMNICLDRTKEQCDSATSRWCGPPNDGNEGLAAGVAAGAAAFVVLTAAASA